MKLYCTPMGPVQANCYVLIDEETKVTAVIDPGAYPEELKNLLHSEEVGEIKYVLLTHGHFDHILGVYDLKQDFPNAKVCIHKDDAQCLHDNRLSLADMGDELLKPLECDIALSEGDKIEIGSTELTVMHTPGHTPGGVCYMDEKDRAIFTGDTLFCLTVGRTDFIGGDESALLKSVKRLYDLEGDYQIFTGHNRSTTLSYERRRNRCMRIFKVKAEDKQ